MSRDFLNKEINAQGARTHDSSRTTVVIELKVFARVVAQGDLWLVRRVANRLAFEHPRSHEGEFHPLPFPWSPPLRHHPIQQYSGHPRILQLTTNHSNDYVPRVPIRLLVTLMIFRYFNDFRSLETLEVTLMTSGDFKDLW